MKSWIQTRLLRHVYIAFVQWRQKDFLPTFIVAAPKTFSVLFNPTNFLLLIDYFCWTKTILWFTCGFLTVLVFNTFNWIRIEMLGALNLFKEAVGNGARDGPPNSPNSPYLCSWCTVGLRACPQGTLLSLRSATLFLLSTEWEEWSQWPLNERARTA